MDKEQEADPAAKDLATTASLASRRGSILSGEWISLPTLSVPVDNEVPQSTEEQHQLQQHRSSPSKAADDSERRRNIDRMMAALTRDATMTLVRSASEADSIRDRDIALFHGVYSVCFKDAQPLISLLKEEMLIQMLEDLGEHLLGKHILDSAIALMERCTNALLVRIRVECDAMRSVDEGGCEGISLEE
ncbi:hypothetical protein EC968_010041 [Mortierella alpina]|nr:hypothetical protein EC968_010041 [Mortierella alpina]